MIKRKRGWLKRRTPIGFRSIIGGRRRRAVFKHSRKHNANCVASRIAAGISECANLLELNIAEPCLLNKLSPSRIFERLVFINEAAGKSPLTLERFMRPPDQQNLKLIGLIPRTADEDNVDGQRRARVIVAIVLGVIGFGSHVLRSAFLKLAFKRLQVIVAEQDEANKLD